MSPTFDGNTCHRSALIAAYAIHALPPNEAADIAAHIASCPQCRQELETLRPVADTFVFWPNDVLRPVVVAARAPRATDRG
jgi:anti-sigma factor RsiW